jgi:hypothetical protein
MSGRIIAELTCDRCGKALWGDDDNLQRLRQEAVDLHSWKCDSTGDTCSTCVLEILAQSVEGWEGPIAERIEAGGYQPWWPL